MKLLRQILQQAVACTLCFLQGGLKKKTKKKEFCGQHKNDTVKNAARTVPLWTRHKIKLESSAWRSSRALSGPSGWAGTGSQSPSSSSSTKSNLPMERSRCFRWPMLAAATPETALHTSLQKKEPVAHATATQLGYEVQCSRGLWINFRERANGWNLQMLSWIRCFNVPKLQRL